jgi:hypothetical protein
MRNPTTASSLSDLLRSLAPILMVTPTPADLGSGVTRCPCRPSTRPPRRV